MRTISQSNQFKKDYKREAKGHYRAVLDAEFLIIIQSLAIDYPLPMGNRDHILTGDYIGHRECHVKPDLLLIYRKPDNELLQLVRLGSHSKLF